MNQLTEEINLFMEPTAALVVYKGQGDSVCKYCVELRRMDSNGKMGEGMPVTYDFMNKIAANYSEIHSYTPHGVIPSNLLYCDTRNGNEKYIWYNPPQRRMMYFSQSLNIENAEYNIPGIIYEAKNNGLNIYAFKGGKPSKDTELFAAPFFNVSRAVVCLGTAKIDKPSGLSYTDMLNYWEKKFWLTEFSHLGSNGNPTKSNLVLVTKAARNAEFNMDELQPLKLTLNNILR